MNFLMSTDLISLNKEFDCHKLVVTILKMFCINKGQKSFNTETMKRLTHSFPMHPFSTH